MTPKYDLSVAPDGEHISVRIPCGPLVEDHRARIPTAEMQEAVAVARSRQLGIDSRGDL